MAHESAKTSTQLSLVAAGLGVAVLPESVRSIALDGVQYRAVSGTDPVELALSWRRNDDSPLVDSFLAMLEDNNIFIDSTYCRRAPVKITAIEAIPFAIPYTKPLRFASGEVHTAEHVLVRVHSDDGVVGVAEAPPRPFTYGETQESIVAAIRRCSRRRSWECP